MEEYGPELSAVLAAWNLSGASATRIPSGHINLTFRLDHARGFFSLQRLNKIFSPEIHHDIEAVTARIEACGLKTPRLIRTKQGELWTTDSTGEVWRLFSWIEGTTFLVAGSPERSREAGRFLGQFHRALWNWDYVFRHGRFGVHDTPKHLRGLVQALSQHADHPNFPVVEPLARAILEQASHLDLEKKLPERIVHGDPKISNVVFDPAGGALCLIDLDTLARMPIAVELGDAFRSWCHPGGEEVEAEFDLDLFREGLSGYAAAIADRPGIDERAAIPGMVLQISLELAARFCTDALNESYFGYDRSRFPTASEHNLVRTRAQLTLARSIRSRFGDLEHLVAATWR